VATGARAFRFANFASSGVTSEVQEASSMAHPKQPAALAIVS